MKRDITAVETEVNWWGDSIPAGQGVPAKVFKCGYCCHHWVFTGPKLEPFTGILRGLQWAHTSKYGWICPDCNPANVSADRLDDGQA